MSNARLETISDLLKMHGFHTLLLDKSIEIPFERLEVDFGLDYKGRPRNLVIRIDNFLISPEESNPVEDFRQTKNQIAFFHAFVAFPFQYTEHAAGELARLILYFNKNIALPGFGLDEMNKLVFFRYSLPLAGLLAQRNLCIGIIGSFMLLIDSLTPQIEAVAQGATMVDTLRHTIQTLTGEIAA